MKEVIKTLNFVGGRILLLTIVNTILGIVSLFGVFGNNDRLITGLSIIVVIFNISVFLNIGINLFGLKEK
jgi:hypothetical protein